MMCSRLNPLGRRSADFFPACQPVSAIPISTQNPSRYRTWRQYAEPIGDFIGAAQMFRLAADAVSRLTSDLPYESRLWPEISKGLRILNALSGSVRPVVVLDRSRRLRPGWAAGSLLAVFATVLQQGTDAHRRLLRCEGCLGVFTTDDSRMRWCSKECRGRNAQRAYRGRKRAK